MPPAISGQPDGNQQSTDDETEMLNRIRKEIMEFEASTNGAYKDDVKQDYQGK